MDWFFDQQQQQQEAKNHIQQPHSQPQPPAVVLRPRPFRERKDTSNLWMGLLLYLHSGSMVWCSGGGFWHESNVDIWTFQEKGGKWVPLQGCQFIIPDRVQLAPRLEGAGIYICDLSLMCFHGWVSPRREPDVRLQHRQVFRTAQDGPRND